MLGRIPVCRNYPPTETATICSIPDEILLHILKVASDSRHYFGKKYGEYNYEFIVDVVSKVSPRFNRLARDPTLWKESGWNNLGELLASIPILNARRHYATLESLYNHEHLMLKIIRMAAEWDFMDFRDLKYEKELPAIYKYHDKHNRSVICKVVEISREFRQVVARSDLWDGNIVLDWKDAGKMNAIISEFLGAGTKAFCANAFSDNSTPVLEETLMVLAKRCENLRALALCHTVVISTNLTAMGPVWISLEELYLYKCGMPNDVFKGVKLHLLLPNLKRFCLELIKSVGGGRQKSSQNFSPKDIFILPDMRGCTRLRTVDLRGLNMRFPPLINELGQRVSKVLLPRELKKAVLNAVVADTLVELASCCPNLEELCMHVPDLGCYDMFKGVSLPAVLPELRQLYISSSMQDVRPVLLPDMRGSRKLRVAIQ